MADPVLKRFGKQKWLPLFQEFITNIRIDSKEVQAEDERGARLLLWDSQLMAMQTLCSGLDEGIREFYFLKGRQQGITTINLALILFWLAVNPRTIGALVVDTPENRNAFRDTLERMVSSLPAKFVGRGDNSFTKEKHNASFFLFKNMSRLDYLVAGTKNKTTWAESRGYSVAILSEVSKYGTRAGLDSFYETLPQTHPNRLVIYESTANGWANHWRDMWEEAGRDTLTKRRCFIGWWAKKLNSIRASDKRYHVYGMMPPKDEEREMITEVYEKYGYKITQEQLAWYRWRSSNKSSDEGSLAQNQPSTEEEAFVRTGSSFFMLSMVQRHIEHVVESVFFKGYRFYLGESLEGSTIEEITDVERKHEVELRIYEMPVPSATYVIGCDPAFGRSDDADNHAIIVCRCYADKLVQVAEYAVNTAETYHCAWVLCYLASLYKNCWLNIELGGPGRAVLRELDIQRQRLRSNLYKPKPNGPGALDDFLEHAQWYLFHRPDAIGAGYMWHFETTQRSKFMIMNQLRDTFQTNMFLPRSKSLLEEMANMTQAQNDIAPAAAGSHRNHDDRVFALALCNLTWLDWTRSQMIETGETYEMVNKKESGVDTRPDRNAIGNLIVQGFLARVNEQAEMEEVDAFLDERGLV